VARWEIVQLAKNHRKDTFDCGSSDLDTYIRTLASQHAKRNVSRTYVAVRAGERVVRGFYTIATGSVAFQNVPEELKKKLPRYPIPTVHLARLAVDQTDRGTGLGKFLMMDALKRAAGLSRQVGIQAVDVVAKDDSARSFYLKYGFVELTDDTRHLYISMKSVQKLFP